MIAKILMHVTNCKPWLTLILFILVITLHFFLESAMLCLRHVSKGLRVGATVSVCLRRPAHPKPRVEYEEDTEKVPNKASKSASTIRLEKSEVFKKLVAKQLEKSPPTERPEVTDLEWDLAKMVSEQFTAEPQSSSPYLPALFIILSLQLGHLLGH